MSETSGIAAKLKGPRGKVFLIGGGLVAVGVVYYIRHRASTASNASAAIDPTIDPSTGVPYADESGDYSGAGGIVSGSPYGALSPTGITAATDIPANNQTYASNLINLLVSEGYDRGAVSSAIGKWLSGSGAQLNATETGIVQVAQGLGGSPPTSVPAPNYITNQGQSTGPDFTVPFITGDNQQDTAIARSSYVAGAYQAYQHNQTAATQKQYLDAFTQYIASTTPKATVPTQTATPITGSVS